MPGPRIFASGQYRRAAKNCSETRATEQTMLDVILIALGLCFFALSVGYAHACDRL
jgi:hypothetical protein